MRSILGRGSCAVTVLRESMFLDAKNDFFATHFRIFDQYAGIFRLISLYWLQRRHKCGGVEGTEVKMKYNIFLLRSLQWDIHDFQLGEENGGRLGRLPL